MPTPVDRKPLTRVRASQLVLLTAIAISLLAPATGQAARPKLSLSPSGSFSYGALDVGQTKAKKFKLKNKGTAATGRLTIKLSGADAAAFTRTGDHCSRRNLRPRKSCTFTVKFTATAEVASRATLSAKGRNRGAKAHVVLTGSAPRHIYWVGGGIGRATLDGQNVETNFVSGLEAPTDVAVDSGHIYWTVNGPRWIGRANLDGSNVEKDWIQLQNYPSGVAVDPDWIYWGVEGFAGGEGSPTGVIGYAGLDGSSVHENFVGDDADTNHISDVTVDSKYIYWTDKFTGNIGRASVVDGSHVTSHFISGASGPWGIAVDPKHNMLYWANSDTHTIGRADLNDPANPNQTFITTAQEPLNLAVDSRYIYWTTYPAGTIGRANLDGTNPQQVFITGTNAAFAGLAVDAG